MYIMVQDSRRSEPMLDMKKAYDLMERTFPVGWRPVDTGGSRRAKAAFVVTMIVFAVFTIVIGLAPGRSKLELLVDGSLVIFCVAAVLVLHLSQNLRVAFGFVMFAGILHLAAYFFLHGNRDGEFFFFILLGKSKEKRGILN